MSCENKIVRWLLAGSILSGIAPVLVLGTAAQAQTAPVGATSSTTAALPTTPAPVAAPEPAVQEVIVTGTSIRGVAPVGSATISVNAAQLEKSGQTTITDALRAIPQVTFLGADDVQGGAAQQLSVRNVSRARAINLRGLGPGDTLVLIDGHRQPLANLGQFFDIDNIPEAAVGRIEVVADGASAIYGSDAVAGVVNLTLKRNYDGFESSVREQAADGYDTFRFSQLVGKTWEGGNLMAVYEHDNNSALKASDRFSIANGNLSDIVATSLPTVTNVSRPVINAGGGNFYVVPTGQMGQGLTASQLTKTNSAGLPYLPLGDSYGLAIVPESYRDSFIASLHQQLTPKIEFGLEGHYSYHVIDSYPGSLSTINAGATVPVPNSNPASPCFAGKSLVGNPGINCSGSSLNVLYNYANDFGSVEGLVHDTNYSISPTLTIELPARWKADLAVNYGQDITDVTNLHKPNATAFSQALSGTLPGFAGTYFDPFCDYSAVHCNSPSLINAITAEDRTGFTYELQDYVAKADGPLFRLPAGDVRLAVGTEFTYTRVSGVNAANTTTPTPSQETQVFFGGSREVTAGFVELYVPIVGEANALPFVRKVDLSVAVRTEHYSDFGDTTNPKIGLNWNPLDDLKLRATYGTSFHAPRLSDIIPDAGGTNSTRTQQAANLPGIQNYVAGTTIYDLYQAGGSLGLKPETATTYSLGLNYNPNWLRGLTIDLNAYRITYHNVITSPGVGTVPITQLDSDPNYAQYITFNPTYFPGRSNITQAQFNALVTCIQASTCIQTGHAETPGVADPYGGTAVTPANVVSISNGHQQNSGSTFTKGLDLQVYYRWQNSFGNLTAGLSGNYVDDWLTTVTPGAPLTDLDNYLGYPLRFRGRGEFDWDKGPYTAALFVNYENPYRIIASSLPVGTPAQYQKVAAYTTVDLNVSWDLTGATNIKALNGVRLSAGVVNILDQDPPIAINSPARYDPFNGSAIGRLVTVELRKKW